MVSEHQPQTDFASLTLSEIDTDGPEAQPRAETLRPETPSSAPDSLTRSTVGPNELERQAGDHSDSSSAHEIGSSVQENADPSETIGVAVNSSPGFDDGQEQLLELESDLFQDDDTSPGVSEPETGLPIAGEKTTLEEEQKAWTIGA